MIIIPHAVVADCRRFAAVKFITHPKSRHFTKIRRNKRLIVSDTCGDNGIKGLNPILGHEHVRALFPELPCDDEVDHVSK